MAEDHRDAAVVRGLIAVLRGQGGQAPASFAEALGLSQEQLRDDPAAVMAALREAVAGGREALVALREDDPHGPERVAALAAVVRQHGEFEDAAQALERLPEAVREGEPFTGVVAALDKVTARVEALTERLRQRGGAEE